MIMIILSIEEFAKLSKSARIKKFYEYPPKAKRFKNGEIEIVVRNRKNKQLWININYCVRDKFEEYEIEELKDAIRK